MDKENNKTYNQKEKKKSKKGKILFFLLLIAVVLCLLFLPVFNVKTVNVTNNKKVSTDEIKRLANITPDSNLFRTLSGQVEERIKENPYIESASITKKIPSTIDIYITEREVKYLVSIDDGYLYLSEQGYVLEKSTFIDDTKLLIKNMELSEEELKEGSRLSEANLIKLNDIANIILSANNTMTDEENKISIGSLIKQINIDNDKDEYILYLTEDNKIVYLGDEENLTIKMQNLKEILSREKGNEGTIYLNIDFRERNPFFSPKV
jgi:cell division protein FtsQ